MKQLFLNFLTLLTLATSACTKNNSSDDPGPGTSIPSNVKGKWAFGGSFSLNDFENYDGSYGGKAFEQGMVFYFKPNGKYELYVINAATSYNCRTEAFTFNTGNVTFNESEGTFTIRPLSGTMRGYYSCAPSKNFKRNAHADELKTQKYYYVIPKNSQGETVMNISTTPSVNDGADFDFDPSE
ncbi:hypothetical protein QNI19_33100 [Cytophagaceae bacterium DM2B3-1]|uniref:Lipocalin-like domain-containing protein n=1 Tax=Xanthocytophaga flava TaxID=3048013 RepID=A0ABT7CWD8_9BACT|nr:hypothetical protein [Xanthocytophaga flavus]MDJ1497826.1 hypothetical protein [Xanthocytophaga flavus]